MYDKDNLDDLIAYLGLVTYQAILDRIVIEFTRIFGEPPQEIHIVGSYAEGVGEPNASDIDIYLVTPLEGISKLGGKGFEFVKAINPNRIDPHLTSWIEMGGLWGNQKADLIDPVGFGGVEGMKSESHFRHVKVWG